MKNLIFQGILFDADGTLYDSSLLHFEAYRAVSKKLYGFDFTKELFDEECMKKNKQPVAILQEHGINCTTEEFYKLKKPYYEDIARKKLRATPGLMGFLQTIRGSLIPVGVVSSATKHSISTSLDIVHLTAYFPIIVAYEDIPDAQKPSPESYLLGAKLLGKPANSCLVFEDTAVGIQAAKSAGMKCIAVRNVTNSDSELQEADLIIQSYSELHFTFTHPGIELTFP
ncbi:MAG: HAD family phosphatase [Candidatus Peribacteraceae bacterium]|nr:HAD family phosphatase [Candidatus Peribacteraceae bacterium]